MLPLDAFAAGGCGLAYRAWGAEGRRGREREAQGRTTAQNHRGAAAQGQRNAHHVVAEAEIPLVAMGVDLHVLVVDPLPRSPGLRGVADLANPLGDDGTHRVVHRAKPRNVDLEGGDVRIVVVRVHVALHTFLDGEVDERVDADDALLSRGAGQRRIVVAAPWERVDLKLEEIDDIVVGGQ